MCRGGKKIRLSQPQQMMAQERHIVEEAYAGDIIGVFDPGIFSIGDTICNSNKKFAFEGIPTFAPEHFARVRQIDTMKRKQFIKVSARLHRRVQFRFSRSSIQEWKRLLLALSVFFSLKY